MSITYEEALATLQSMFGEPWTRESLDSVLRHFKGHMENTVDSILSHGDGSPQSLINKLKAKTSGTSLNSDAELARQLASEDNKGSIAPTREKGRGTPTDLPPDFLRVPGYKGTGGGGGVDRDEQLARMLQDELFSQELANNPEFAHLAQGGRAGGGSRAVGGRPIAAGTSSQRRVGELPSRTVGGIPPRRPGEPEGPNMMDKLTEMGETAKKRLQLFASQWNTTNKPFGSPDPAGGGAGGSSGATERRGLLDGGDDEGTEMEMSFASKKAK